MNDRINRLRERSLRAVPTISAERALLLTEFYRTGLADRVPVTVARAMAFEYILKNKSVCIDEGELIVGERGPVPKATPTYPEICIHSISDLHMLNDRAKIPFEVTAETLLAAESELVPFWKGRAIRDRIFELMTEDWKDAYEAGVFTEFMEQRAPGHTVSGGKIYSMGMRDFIAMIEDRLKSLDYYNDPDSLAKRDELEAMKIAAGAIIAFAHRHADAALKQAENESDPQRREELKTIANVCRKVPEQAPSTFREALQYYWFIHLGVIIELNTWDSFNPGRLDQHLCPFYIKETDAGTLTREEARELLQAFWIKFNNQPAPPKVGVTAEESGTYTDFCLINVGGVKDDGSDAVNDLTYMILEVIEEMRLLQPSSMVQVSKKNPDRFLMRALQIVETGFGQPSIFNTDVIIQELIRQGKSIIDARSGGASGCVESGAFGKEAYILTGYFNLVKILELALHRGFDIRTGKKIGPDTGDPSNWSSFDDVITAFAKQLNHFVDVKIRGNQVIERLYASYLPAPFLSILIDDCIAKGVDYNAGGARYNTSYIQGVGLASLTDSLSAIHFHVFDKKHIDLKSLMRLLDDNFSGDGSIKDALSFETPRFGNDNEYADSISRTVFDIFFDAIDGRPNTRGGHYRINLLPTTCHVYFGKVVGAMPDGREAGEPLSEGISPVQGMDRKGPTAVLKSVSKLDHVRTGGTLLNQKFTPDLMKDEADRKKVMHLVRSYFKMDGHHIQFNVVTAETLKEAQLNPEKYADLIVRVAGYSDYFIDLSLELQNEIIKRTEQAVY